MPADFTQPGDDGGLEPETVTVSSKGLARLGRTLAACNEVYRLVVRVEQRVRDCGGSIDYKALYQRADTLASTRLVLLKCDPAGACPEKVFSRVSFSWACKDRVSYSEVRYEVYCKAGAGPLLPLPDPPSPRDADFDGPHKSLEDLEDYTIAQQEWLIENIPTGKPIGNVFLGCPDTQTFRYTYYVPLFDGPPVNFKAAVNEGTAAARAYAGAFSCTGACNKAVKVVRTEWDYARLLVISPFGPAIGVVVVTVYLEIACA